MTESAQILEVNFNDDTQKIKLPPITAKVLKVAYAYCAAITQGHYENFPVASVLLPKNIRPSVQAIYAFSRIADDFADESHYKNTRLQHLNDWEYKLLHEPAPTHPVFMALNDTISKHNLPVELFANLLKAFKMDVTINRYKDFTDLLHYCEHSANPVGRLVLHLHKYSSVELFKLSDYICTALQLTNFWQDVAVDLKKNRVYLPQDELDKFDYPLSAISSYTYNKNFKRLMQFECERTTALFNAGKPLGLCLTGRLGVEIRLTWLTGVTILNKIKAVDYDVFNQRPTLTKTDFSKLFFIALSRRRYQKFKPR